MAVEIVALLVSPIHAYVGRPQDGPLPDPEPPSRTQVQVRAGLGLVGDRYYGHPAHRRAAVTVLDADAMDAVAVDLGVAPFDLLRTRRNIIVRGFPVDELARTRTADGAVFSLDSGLGPVRFQAHHPASPCRWMDTRLTAGAWKAMRRHGGVRCEPLDDGTLHLGPATLHVLWHSAPAQWAASSQLRP